MIRWLNPLVWWRRLQRSIDAQVLIPEMQRACGDEYTFARAFALHIGMDRAWQVDDWEYTEREREFLQRLLRL